MKFYTHSLLISVLLLFVTACGGGGGGTPVVQGGTPVGDANPNGIYSGTYIDNGTSYPFSGLVQGGEFVGLSIANSKIHTGTAVVDGQSLSGTLNVYEIGAGALPTSTLSATFVEGESISGTITDVDGMDTFSLTIDPIYNRPPNTTLAGTYMVSLGGTTFTITSDNDGTFTGADTDSCIYSGTQVKFDATHNFYRLTVGVTGIGCSFVGDYTGYAFNDDDAVDNDNNRLVWVIDDPAFILILSMTRT